MSLIHRVLRRGRDAVRHAMGQRDGLRVFYQRPRLSMESGRGDINHGAVAAIQGMNLIRNVDFDQSVSGLPADAEAFYYADSSRIASWGLLVPNVTRWPVTEVDGLIVTEKPISVLISFYTLEPYRGRGLYPALLRTMCQFACVSGCAPDLLIWCHRSNHASVRGIQKAGFDELGGVRRSLSGRTLLMREPELHLMKKLGLQFVPRG